jgi:nucleotide-binding universal stress UspA family protein
MKTIIIPTDFSPVATNALHYGIEMAKATGSGILLFHAYQVPISYSDVPLVLVSVEELQKTAEDRMASLKTEVDHITSGVVDVRTDTRLGNTVDELELLCKEVKPLAVVMGTKGVTGLERVIFGSTTLTTIRHLSYPVICVPPGKNFGTGIQKIGLACDFREVENTPTHLIREFISEFDAQLYVLNVDHESMHFDKGSPAQLEMFNKLFGDLDPQYHFIDDKEVEKAINRFAEENNLDLVITIPRKHKLLEGLFKPGTTKQLVFEAHVPVMCVHE